MPYVNIPKSNFVGGIARIVGKLQGDISSKVVTRGATIASSFRRQGCPTTSGISRIRSQKEGLDSGINKVKDKSYLNELRNKNSTEIIKTKKKSYISFEKKLKLSDSDYFVITLKNKYEDYQ